MFENRHAAGLALALAQALQRMPLDQPVVLAIARGGLPVAAPIANALSAPLDLLLVRKIGVPWQPELAAAAVIDGEAPEIVLDEPVMQASGLDLNYIQEQAQVELAEIQRRRRTYLGARPPRARDGPLRHRGGRRSGHRHHDACRPASGTQAPSGPIGDGRTRSRARQPGGAA